MSGQGDISPGIFRIPGARYLFMSGQGDLGFWALGFFGFPGPGSFLSSPGVFLSSPSVFCQVRMSEARARAKARARARAMGAEVLGL